MNGQQMNSKPLSRFQGWSRFWKSPTCCGSARTRLEQWFARIVCGLSASAADCCSARTKSPVCLGGRSDSAVGRNRQRGEAHPAIQHPDGCSLSPAGNLGRSNAICPMRSMLSPISLSCHRRSDAARRGCWRCWNCSHQRHGVERRPPAPRSSA